MRRRDDRLSDELSALRAEVAVLTQRLHDLEATSAERHDAALATGAATVGELLSASEARQHATLESLTALVQELASESEIRHRRLLDVLRVVRDDDIRARQQLLAMRASADYEAAFEEDEPLVSVIVTTYQNWPLLRDRCLPSILEQSYQRFEVVVVGDAAPAEAGQVVSSFNDERLRFVNLPYNGPYPKERHDAWLVSGSTPFNAGWEHARGRWIGSNSDDDALRPNYIESLLQLARAERAEVPYGTIRQVEPGDNESILRSFPPEKGQWGTQCSMFHAGLRTMPMQTTDWLFGEPNDSAWVERMLRIGVRFAFIDEPVIDYYPSFYWRTATPNPVSP